MQKEILDRCQQLVSTLLPFSANISTGATLTLPQIAGLIDHTALKADTSSAQIDLLCQEARTHQFASVCVNSIFVAQAAEALAGSDVAVCTVVGFPLGASLTVAKVAEAEAAIAHGASEIDMVLPIGLLKSGANQAVYEDIAAVVIASHAHNALVKVIIETCLLTDAEKIIACVLSQAAGADFVKTSTGFNATGATVHDVALMRQVVGPDIGVKAAGGVRSYTDALQIVAAGASRIGASAGVTIVAGGSTGATGY